MSFACGAFSYRTVRFPARAAIKEQYCHFDSLLQLRGVSGVSMDLVDPGRGSSWDARRGDVLRHTVARCVEPELPPELARLQSRISRV